MALGVNISKANIAVESKPVASIMISKANVAVESRPVSAVLISKANIAVESNLTAVGGTGRRRALIMP